MPGSVPRARREGLLVEPLGEETLVYDLDRDRAHCLNRTAALVWAACDGQRDVAAIARHVAGDMPEASSELVQVALARLSRAHLLTTPAGGMPRRAALRRLSVAAGLLPLVYSIVVPEPAQAATCHPRGGCCRQKADCCPGLNCTGPQDPPCGPAPQNKTCA